MMPYGQLSVFDPDDIDTRGQDFTAALPPSDTLQSCTVTVVSGSVTVAPALGGTYASTATATIIGNEAQVAIQSTGTGAAVLRFRGTSTAGRRIDLSETLSVQSR